MSMAATLGYYWSASQSTVNTERSSYLSFGSGSVAPATSGFRPSGLSVRCVAEL
ncbi:MAG: fibrobacter succinogenes major paralogous domain-containing protein [Alistipes sp.]|nr:fibrobacter succinogenes major paralogous domain-containing protein [Alistipes sp.]